MEVTAGESIGEGLPSEDPPSFPLLALLCCWPSNFFLFLLDSRLFQGGGERRRKEGRRRRGREGEDREGYVPVELSIHTIRT